MTKYYKTKETCIRNINAGVDFERQVYDLFRNDRDVVLAACKRFSWTIIPEIYRDDKEIALAALNAKSRCYTELSPRLREDRDVLEAYIYSSHFPESKESQVLRLNDMRLTYAMCCMNPILVSELPETISADKDFIEKLVSNGSWQTAIFMPRVIKDDGDFMNKLIAININTFSTASEKLRSNPGWYMQHLNGNANFIKDILPSESHSEDFFYPYLESNPTYYIHLEQSLKKSVKLARVVAHDVECLRHMPDCVLADDIVALEGMKATGGDLYSRLPIEQRSNKEVLRVYLTISRYSTSLTYAAMSELPASVMQLIGFSGANWRDCPQEKTQLLELLERAWLSEELENELPQKSTKQMTLKI